MDVERIQRELILSGRDRRYPVQAYALVLKGLDYALARSGERRHLSGSELSGLFAEFAATSFGPSAIETLTKLRILSTSDIGSIIYNMIGLGIVTKQPADTLDDFTDVFNLHGRIAGLITSELDKNHLKTISGA